MGGIETGILEASRQLRLVNWANILLLTVDEAKIPQLDTGLVL